MSDLTGLSQAALSKIIVDQQARIEELKEKLHWKVVSHIAADDRIEHLRAQVKELEAALRHISELPSPESEGVAHYARAALQENE